MTKLALIITRRLLKGKQCMQDMVWIILLHQ